MPAAAPLSSASRAALAVLLLALPLAACARTIELVDLQTGSTLAGTHSLWTRSMTVVLPTGDTVTGTYTRLTTTEIGPGSLFFGANAGELLGRHETGRVYGHARLESGRGAVMEIIFASDWLGHGHGIARTGLKEEYRVTF
jgi:hypothetical protein